MIARFRKHAPAMAAATDRYAQEGGSLLRESLSMLAFRTDWAYGYRGKHLSKDVLVGLIIASVLIPNAIAYSILAGVEPIMGLYASFAGALIGAFWGSSRYVVTGPVGIVSLLTLTSLLPLATPGSAEFFTFAIVLAITAGLIQFGLGFFRLGFMMRLIPHSVLIGFTSAAAIIIAATQVPALFGFNVESHAHVFETIFAIGTNITSLHIFTTLIGLSSVVFLLIAKRFVPRLPVGLVLIAGAGLASYLLGFGAQGVVLVGSIPSTLPSLDFNAFTFDTAVTLLAKAFVIAIVGFVETYAIGRAVARETKEKIDANQELVGQGLANIGSGFFGGYSVSGSFSLTALNRSAGAHSRMANVFAALFVLVVIALFGPLLYHLPKAALAALVIVAVSSLVHLAAFRDLARVSRADSVIATATFVLAFLLKPDDAIFIGIIVALVLFMRRVMWVEVYELGVKDIQEKVMYTSEQEKDVTSYPSVLIVRMDMSLIYANSERMIKEIERRLTERELRTGERTQALVINCAGINFIDATGLEGFEELLEEMNTRGITVAIIYPNAGVQKALTTSGLLAKVTHLRGARELHDFCTTVSDEGVNTAKK